MKFKTLNILISLTALLSCLNCFAQKEINEELLNQKFQNANNLYNEGLYKESIEIYSEIFNSGFHSAELYFNLGNSYYKINDMPNAILHYEKALRLDPNDSYIINNLNIANNSVIDKILKVPESFIDLKLDQISNFMNIEDWTYLTILTSFIFLFVFTLYFFSNSTIIKRLSFCVLLLLFISNICFIMMSFNSYQKNHIDRYAIIFDERIEINSEPNDRSDILLILYQGTKVKVIDSFTNDWIKVRLSDGQVGWLEKNKIKII
tara:strand:+ start:1988 stop:2776 length:789 start_codon:yes stop_codon:yes gene_type:complete